MSTKLLTYADAPRATTEYIRDGRAGNFEVVYKMIDLIVGAVENDKGLEDFVKKYLVTDYKDFSGERVSALFTRIYEFVQSHIKYIPDVAGKIESLKSPRRTLSDGYGDCDDHAILNAAILGVLGFEPEIVLMRHSDRTPNFQHIYTIVYVNDRRFVLDTCIPDGKLNDELAAFERQEISVFNNESISNNIAALMFRIKNGLKGAGRETLSALPSLAALLPSGLGYVASNILEQSTAMILNGQAPRSANEIGSKINNELDQLIYQLHSKQIALDHAKMLTRKAVGELETIANRDEIFNAIVERVIPKVEYILSFEDYAKEHAISVVYLDGRAMVLSGALVLGGLGYWYFNKRKRIRRNVYT